MKYELEQIKPKERFYEVKIKADSNDGDYIIEITTCSQKQFDDIVDELINLKENYGGRHELENYPNEWDLNIPCTDYGYCHTLVELEIRMYDTDGCAYNVVLTK